MKRKHILVNTSTLIIMLSMLLLNCEKDDEIPEGLTDADFNSSLSYGTMTDQEGNEYKTINIGIQTWMAENLRTKRYMDGKKIPNVKDHMDWFELYTGAYSTYNNTRNADSIRTYGLLYNGYAMASGKLAPEGWHIPTIEEWEIMISYLGGKYIAGGHLKEMGNKHWNTPNTDAENMSGFTALAGGYREYGSFRSYGETCWWWSATGTNPDIRTIALANDTSAVFYNYQTNNKGLYVRCVKD
jgi:uncharacterized protein (TIGR02145 family)